MELSHRTFPLTESVAVASAVFALVPENAVVIERIGNDEDIASVAGTIAHNPPRYTGPRRCTDNDDALVGKRFLGLDPIRTRGAAVQCEREHERAYEHHRHTYH